MTIRIALLVTAAVAGFVMSGPAQAEPGSAALTGEAVLEMSSAVHADTSQSVTFNAEHGALIAVDLAGYTDDDIDLWVYDHEGELIDCSRGVQGNERILFRAPYSGQYRVEVEHYSGAERVGFDLAVQEYR